MRMYSPEVLDKLISLAHEYGVLCIVDEVMTGFEGLESYLHQIT